MPHRFVHGLASVLFCCFGYWSLRVTYAGYLARNPSRAAMEHAIQWAPGNAEYHARLAEAEPAVALAAIRRAAELNPRSSSIWMQYGTVAESRGDFGQAETCLLEAVRLDKTFAPRWSLSEYYYRRHDAAHFWPAVKAALAASYDDVTPLFQECWDLTADADAILRVIPARVDVLGQYLNFLVNERNRLDLALPVAMRLQEHADRGSATPLLSLCDRLLERGQVSEAVEIWDGLARAKFVPYAPLAPERGAVLTNGQLVQPFLEHGFDWRMAAVDGVYARSAGTTAPLRFTFSGKQPESCELLSQWLPLAPDRRYELRVRYRTGDLEGDTGIVWRLLDAHTGLELLRGSGRMMAAAGADQRFAFATPAGTRLARMVLGYTRVLGTGRINGSISLSEISLGFSE